MTLGARGPTYTFDSFGSSGVFQHYAELGKVEGELLQVRQEQLFSIEDGDVLNVSGSYDVCCSSDSTYLGCVAGYLTMQIQDHTRLLHSLEDGIVHAIVLDTAGRVGGDSARVRLYAFISVLARDVCYRASLDAPEIPAAAAFLISSGVISGPRYSVISHSTLGSILRSSSRYSSARSVPLTGGTRLG